jgi:hypothetical protein
MDRKLGGLILALGLGLAGCATAPTWSATGGSRADATVKLQLTYTAFAKPKVTVEDGLPMATNKCKAWGFDHAEPFGGIVNACTVRNGFGCTQWTNTAEYQCTSVPSK